MRRSRLVAVIFLVVQLLCTLCSANKHSTTSLDRVNHHERHRDNLESLIDKRHKPTRHDIATSENNKMMMTQAVQQQDTSVNEEHSMESVSVSKPKQFNQQTYSATYISVHRQTRDVEDIFNEMAKKDPQEWTAVDWIALILFLTMFCWIYSCMCALCCCGRRGGSGSTIINWLCFWEICCRDGRDLDICCDYANAPIV
jgi:hypothetical protein